MNQRLEKIIKGFKPKFGNTNHIRALEIIGKMRKIESSDLKSKLTTEEKHLIWLLKN